MVSYKKHLSVYRSNGNTMVILPRSLSIGFNWRLRNKNMEKIEYDHYTIKVPKDITNYFGSQRLRAQLEIALVAILDAFNPKLVRRIQVVKPREDKEVESIDTDIII